MSSKPEIPPIPLQRDFDLAVKRAKKATAKEGLQLSSLTFGDISMTFGAPPLPAPDGSEEYNGGKNEMRIKMKGINKVTKRLADGSTRTYWYAWKGGPPLQGKPGSPEFVASFNAAAARKVAPTTGTLSSVLRATN
jgi:hypothetical protein